MTTAQCTTCRKAVDPATRDYRLMRNGRGILYVRGTYHMVPRKDATPITDSFGVSNVPCGPVVVK